MSFFSPAELVQKASDTALHKNRNSLRTTLILAFLAGAYIALGGLLALVVGGGIPGIAEANPGLQKLFMGAVFPLGLFLCVVAGADLFTGNTAYFVPPLLSGKISLGRLLRNWGWVYLGNFVGALFVAWLLGWQTGIFAESPWLDSLMNIAEQKTSASFWVVFAKGVGANWLVALAVWAAFAANDITGKLLALWFPVMAFVAMGFEHSVANMFFLPTALFYGSEVGWLSFLVNNLLPATLGNIAGGALLTGLLYARVYQK